MSWFCSFALRSMVSMARVRVDSSSSLVRSMCAQPTMADSGVRSSCESRARNSSLLRPTSCAFFSSSVRSSSARRLSVMSRAKRLKVHASHAFTTLMASSRGSRLPSLRCPSTSVRRFTDGAWPVAR